MSKLTIEIDTDNAAFWNEDATPTNEVELMLAGIGRNYPYFSMREPHALFDRNGNKVGYWSVTP